MSFEATSQINPQAETQTIIDFDFHIEITEAETLLPYVDDDIVREKLERRGPSLPSAFSVGWPPYAYEEDSNILTHGAALTAEEVIEAMESLALDTVVATPGTLPGIGINAIRHRLVKQELAKAYNGYILDNTIDADRGVLGVFLLPHWNVDEAVAEIARMDCEDGIVGAQSYFDGRVPITGYGLDKEPIFRELAERDIPLFLHPGGPIDNLSEMTGARDSYVESYALGISYNAMNVVANFIFSGLLDKYPDLDIVIQEAGISWIPFIKRRLDEIYQIYPEDVMLVERKREMGEKYLNKLPSEYIRDNFFFSTEPISLPTSQKHAEAMLTLCQVDNSLLFSTDYPHITLDVADWVFEDSGLSEERQARVLSENGQELLGL